MAISISSGFIFDRAAVVTTALLQIFSSSTPHSGLRHHVEELLRDEFADVERQAFADRGAGDDA
jgi:hypothetical protein